jgi:uncharacterized protein (TIGR02466 family)
MILKDIFVSTIFKTVINNNKYKNYFLRQLNNCKKSVTISNMGGFQSENFKKINKEILNNVFLNPAYEFAKKLNPVKNIKLELISYWINLNKQNNYNLMHCHEGFLSGVYYIKTKENCGRLVFQNGDLTKMTNDYFKYFNHSSFYSNYATPVQEGELYLFPSNTLHYVEPNLSNEDRVSVAFNIKVY